jgi:tetratricopeptide (TPR) repeat protein
MQDAQQLYMQAVSYHQSGRLQEAEHLYRQLIKQHPRLDPLYSNLGSLLVSKGELKEAEKMLRQAVKLNPKSSDAHSNLGAALLDRGKLEEAVLSYKKVIGLMPTNAASHYNLANVFVKQGHVNEAIKSYEKALELDSNLAPAHFNLGNLWNEQGEHEKAKAAFEKTIAANPKHAEAYLNLGNLLADSGAFEKATGWYEKAIENNADYAPAYVSLGTLYKEKGESEKAIANFKKALELDPKNADAKREVRRAIAAKVPRWHFTMLADEKRNDAYQQAIERNVNADSNVLDIGTGSGLLSLMAAKAGSKTITTCEMVPEIADVAQQVIADNEYSESINVVSKKSTDLVVGEDLLEKADVLVSEILDVGVFGEGVLPAMRHALKHLVTEDAIVIPRKANMYGMLVEMPERAKINPVKTISGFDLSAFDQFRINDQYSTVHLTNDNHKSLSEVFPIYDVDFKYPPSVTTESKPEEKRLAVTANSDGILHAVVFWFDLHLDDTIMVSTKPGGDMVHWGQAAYFFEIHKEVKAGEEIPLTLIRSDMMMTFRVE